MNKYIKNSHNKNLSERKEFTVFGTINIFVKDPVPSEIDITNVIMEIEDTIPPHLFYEVETIMVGKFKELEQRGIRAAFLDGGIYVTNEQPSDEQLFEDIIHEVAHAVEKMYDYDLYADTKIELEYLAKKKRFIDLLSAHDINVPNRLKYESEYSKAFDEFLHYEVGYEKLTNFTKGLFVTPYASVSVSEYFATAFEMFFVQGEEGYIKEISPELFIKLRQISTQGEEGEEI